MNMINNDSLKPYNTFGINVDAKHFVEVASVVEIKEISSFIENHQMPFLILGGGSNILFTKDFEGLVIKINLKGIELVHEDTNHYYIKALAGENWDDLVKYCVENNYAGLENLSLIPGCVGASPIQNIGAYGVEMKDHFHELELYDLTDDTIRTMNGEACRFGYRSSMFKNELKGKAIILSVTFRLDKIPVFRTEYGAIKDELKTEEVSSFSIQKIREAVIKIRRSKLPDPNEIGNAGSFFKNPTVPAVFRNKLLKSHPGLVSYSQPNGDYKLAAGWLIEQCGWKGRRIGDAGVHEKQALVLVNYGNVTGMEILELSDEIKKSVFETFTVLLEREVNVV